MKVAFTMKYPVTRLTLMRWIREVYASQAGAVTPAEALSLADQINAHVPWEPNQLAAHFYYNQTLIPDFITATFVVPPDPDAEYRRHQKRLYDLLTLGAAGDVAAAVAYCKAELAGEISHGAYAG